MSEKKTYLRLTCPVCKAAHPVPARVLNGNPPYAITCSCGTELAVVVTDDGARLEVAG